MKNVRAKIKNNRRTYHRFTDNELRLILWLRFGKCEQIDFNMKPLMTFEAIGRHMKIGPNTIRKRLIRFDELDRDFD